MVSGSKVLRRATRKVVNRAATAFRIAAFAFRHSDSYLGAQSWRRRSSNRLIIPSCGAAALEQVEAESDQAQQVLFCLAAATAEPHFHSHRPADPCPHFHLVYLLGVANTHCSSIV